MTHSEFLQNIIMPIMDKAFTLTDNDYRGNQFRHELFNALNEAVAYSLLDTLWSNLINESTVDVMCEKCFSYLSKTFNDYTYSIKIATRTNDLFKMHILRQELLVIVYIDVHLHAWYNNYRKITKPIFN